MKFNELKKEKEQGNIDECRWCQAQDPETDRKIHYKCWIR